MQVNAIYFFTSLNFLWIYEKVHFTLQNEYEISNFLFSPISSAPKIFQILFKSPLEAVETLK